MTKQVEKESELIPLETIERDLKANGYKPEINIHEEVQIICLTLASVIAHLKVINAKIGKETCDTGSGKIENETI